MYLSDGGIVVVVSDGGVVIFRGGLGQLRYDLEVGRVWQYNDLECTCLMVVSLWWCLMVVSLYSVEGLVNFIDLGKEHR